MREAYAARELTVTQWRKLALLGQAVPVRVQVNGDSMRPLLRRRRDYVTIVPMDRPPCVGDIVLFPGKRLGGDYVLHRVLRIKGQRMQTLGDGCLHPDAWMDIGQAWGRATRIERGRLTIDTCCIFWRVVAFMWMGLYPIRKWLCLPGRACRWIKRIVSK